MCVQHFEASSGVQNCKSIWLFLEIFNNQTINNISRARFIMITFFVVVYHFTELRTVKTCNCIDFSRQELSHQIITKLS